MLEILPTRFELTFLGATLGQVVDLAGIQHVLELAQDAVALSPAALRVDEHQQGAAQLIRRRDLEVCGLVMMMMMMMHL